MLLDLHGNDPLEGTIVALTDSDSERDAYAIIKVDGIARPLMVPMDHLVLAARPPGRRRWRRTMSLSRIATPAVPRFFRHPNP